MIYWYKRYKKGDGSISPLQAFLYGVFDGIILWVVVLLYEVIK